jgi:predicted extracellular nuclease
VTRRRHALIWSAVIAFALVITAAGSARTDTTLSVSGVVISQVYGGGGNAGATYTNDFVELFNPTDSDIALAGASVQYASAAGSSWQVTTLTGTLAAHHYYLVQEAKGSGGTTPLPAPDASGSIAMSGTAGKVALVDQTTALSGTCPTAIDFVGFGSTANCSETAPAPAPSNTTADLRAGEGCTDTNDNSSDFAVGAPAPRNTASPAHSCATPPPVVTCPANVTVDEGTGFDRSVSASDPDGVVTSFSVTPTTGFSVSDVQPATEAGGTATATVGGDASLAPGTYTVQVTAANDDSPAQTATCSFTVTVTALLPIGTVQGSVPDTGDATTFDSPYVNQTVTVQGVVTELTHEGTNNGFYLQNTAATADSDPTTSDGIFVFLSRFTDTVNGYVPVVGDEIRATGRVSEFFDQTELGSVRATKVGTGAVTPFEANPPADPADAARYWERHEGMLASVPAQSVVDSPTHFYSSTGDTEFYALNPTSPIAQRANPYAQRVYRDAHPLGGGSGRLILITDEGIKAADPNARLTPVHTYQRLTTEVTGGVYYDFGKYSVSASAEPQVGGGVDPYLDGPPPVFDRSQAYSVANFNMENLYDYRDDPNDGCDFDGNAGCAGVTPPFDYTPSSDAEYQGREAEIAHQIVVDLHSPDVIVVQEAEDQDICSVAAGALVCGAADNADGRPDVLEELALHIQAIGGPAYSTAFDRNGADARGIICGFMYRSDRVSLVPAAASDPVLGSSPQVDYRGAPLAYDSDVSNPKALNAVLPGDVDTSTGVDGSNVFTRAVQVAHFRIAPTTLPGRGTDLWVQANHFTSNPDASVGQRQEQAAYNAAVVKAIQSGDADAKVMVAGDLNVYPRPDSDQLHALYDAGLHDLYDTVLAQNPASAYSYSFTGRAQDLDHQFVTQSFFDELNTANEAHVNSDWTRVPGSNRGTSDHDPMVSQWNLPSAFDDVCTLARQLASSPAGADRLCTDLARAEDAAAQGRRVQKALALAGAAADVAQGIVRRVWTPREAAELVKAIAKL